jgi:hypothetical protein
MNRIIRHKLGYLGDPDEADDTEPPKKPRTFDAGAQGSAARPMPPDPAKVMNRRIRRAASKRPYDPLDDYLDDA